MKENAEMKNDVEMKQKEISAIMQCSTKKKRRGRLCVVEVEELKSSSCACCHCALRIQEGRYCVDCQYGANGKQCDVIKELYEYLHDIGVNIGMLRVHHVIYAHWTMRKVINLFTFLCLARILVGYPNM